MTPQEKTIANKLLADFDGLETQPIKDGDTILFDYRNNLIDYSEDWNLIIPVAIKLSEDYPIGNKFFNKQTEYKIRIFTALQNFDINYLFNACYNFIILLNQIDKCTQPTL
jgi:hypothetical protein